jgi:hypothetical protein
VHSAVDVGRHVSVTKVEISACHGS